MNLDAIEAANDSDPLVPVDGPHPGHRVIPLRGGEALLFFVPNIHEAIPYHRRDAPCGRFSSPDQAAQAAAEMERLAWGIPPSRPKKGNSKRKAKRKAQRKARRNK